jgi:Uma2 family endonuclease
MYDYVTKMNWYKQAGVKKYWIINSKAREILAYRFFSDDVEHYTFNDSVEVSIWNGEFSIDFSQIDLS